jgi:hypothetical protein
VGDRRFVRSRAEQFASHAEVPDESGPVSEWDDQQLPVTPWPTEALSLHLPAQALGADSAQYACVAHLYPLDAPAKATSVQYLTEALDIGQLRHV